MVNHLQGQLFRPTRDNDRSILASRNVFQEWFIRGVCWASHRKNLVIIDIIKDANPFSYLLIMEPVLYEFEYIRLRILTTWDFDPVCDFPETLLEPGFGTPMHPENPYSRRLGSDLVRVFAGPNCVSFSLTWS